MVPPTKWRLLTHVLNDASYLKKMSQAFKMDAVLLSE